MRLEISPFPPPPDLLLSPPGLLPLCPILLPPPESTHRFWWVSAEGATAPIKAAVKGCVCTIFRSTESMSLIPVPPAGTFLTAALKCFNTAGEDSSPEVPSKIPSLGAGDFLACVKVYEGVPPPTHDKMVKRMVIPNDALKTKRATAAFLACLKEVYEGVPPPTYFKMMKRRMVIPNDALKTKRETAAFLARLKEVYEGVPPPTYFKMMKRGMVIPNDALKDLRLQGGHNKYLLLAWFSADESDVNTLCFADISGHPIYSGGDDNLCKVWDRRCFRAQGKAAGILIGHPEGVTFLDSRGDGRSHISNGKDQSI